MRVDHLQNINVLGLLSLLGTYVVHASTSPTTPSPECSIQTWVRAPDLTPGTIIQGDARLKLTPGCTAIESASLGLRFKERSFVKASRDMEVTKRPANEHKPIHVFGPENISPSSPWLLPMHAAINCSDNMALAEIVKNKDLWFVREEECVVFKSTQAIDMGELQPDSVPDVARDFAILVPSTNFPPALDYPHSSNARPREEEFVNVETMYEYFVRVMFTNGTTAEIQARFTAFHPLYDPPSDNLVRSKTVQLQMKESLNGSLVDSDPIANYTAEIISKHDGFTFYQGSDDQFVKVAISRTGRARTFVEPLNLHLCIASSISPKWASEHTSKPTLQSVQAPSQILRATQGRTPLPKQISMPNATADQIAAGEIVTTTTKPVLFLIDPELRHATDFETYYHTLSGALVLSLDVPRTQDEPLSAADMFELRASRKKTPEVEEDEEDWVPWYKVPEVTRWRGVRTYSGNASVSVYPATGAQLPKHCVRARDGLHAGALTDSVQAVLATGKHNRHDHSDCALRSLVHYLSEAARAPTFVDGNAASVHDLLAKTPAERDLLAPSLEPVVSSPPEGEERVHRYYRVPEGQRPLIYVGETWVKKVAHRDEHKITAPRPDAMPSVLANMERAMQRMVDEL